MSDSDSLSEYPSDLECEIRDFDYKPTEYSLDSGVESNDGYLTDEIELNKRDTGLSRNKRILKKKLRRYFRIN